MRVFVLDKNKKSLNPTHPARARKFLNSGRARVFKQCESDCHQREKSWNLRRSRCRAFYGEFQYFNKD
ncbi:MAG: RRXRR domain-containing protein [Roseofilum sp. Belize BBD 4]|nr:RRXRR domain-containing protein [Roseofilum sp. Belize Diploria]MBP0034100.1 RRXRR domain-containing protein [Roseofilum sp. Belize BBD 4]